ncbi:hypothetical protein [Fischerella sp. PCC 9605]|uniref:hypothetical protein n=1 Tax=Fischerella sp. PCC 9605 TaxID=1173024 RepID=UPI00047B8969|nr:hypothetical protein [Fischerella sp. PCC 9605]
MKTQIKTKNDEAVKPKRIEVYLPEDCESIEEFVTPKNKSIESINAYSFVPTYLDQPIVQGSPEWFDYEAKMIASAAQELKDRIDRFVILLEDRKATTPNWSEWVSNNLQFDADGVLRTFKGLLNIPSQPDTITVESKTEFEEQLQTDVLSPTGDKSEESTSELTELNKPDDNLVNHVAWGKVDDKINNPENSQQIHLMHPQKERRRHSSKDLLYPGYQVGKLTLLEYVGKRLWNCKCECGNISQHRTDHLKKSRVKSCGCSNASAEKLISYDGKTLNIRQWAKEIGITQAALSRRLQQGWSVEEALETPPNYPRGNRKTQECIQSCLVKYPVVELTPRANLDDIL